MSNTESSHGSGRPVASGTAASAGAGAAGAPDTVRFIPVQRSYYPVIVAAFVAIFLISNILATKGVEIGPLVTDGAFFLFPAAYVLGDVLSEVYGFRAARRAILTGFAVAALAVVCFYVAIWLPAASFYENQDEFSLVLGLVPQIVLASLAGYLVGQLLNSWVLVRMKRRLGPANMWARLIGSTVVGEFADTLLFCLIAAPVIGIATAGDALNYVVVGFLWKTLIEVVVLPVTYAVIRHVKRREAEWNGGGGGGAVGTV
ncbi:queuosine precursor transporter [Corynebacterium frankenforstense]|uniref:queuosine precursor transporter n=1 Tax=Corynebacterium frankenforstense TaxID=1230998 RepID=UPI0026F14D80|nr:queuosine precursor transporter [Corynebacterium frankenforstense]